MSKKGRRAKAGQQPAPRTNTKAPETKTGAKEEAEDWNYWYRDDDLNDDLPVLSGDDPLEVEVDVNGKALEEIDRVTGHEKKDNWDSYSGGSYRHAGYTSGKTYVTEPKCYHSGNYAFVNLDGVEIAAAQGHCLDGYEAELVIDLAGQYKPIKTGFLATPSWEPILGQYIKKQADVLDLDWKDYSIPPVGVEFWRALWREVKRREYKNIVVCCVGAHGRTGTCIAALLIVVANHTADQAIKFVRKEHCEKAIESQSQEAYLRALAKEVKKTTPDEDGEKEETK